MSQDFAFVADLHAVRLSVEHRPVFNYSKETNSKVFYFDECLIPKLSVIQNSSIHNL